MASNSTARERQFKDQAERLREFLGAAGVDLKHTTALQALAHMHKAQDWRALLASNLEPLADVTAQTSPKFITLTVVSDTADPLAGPRPVALRVDHIASVVDVTPEKYLFEPAAKIHVTEPCDWEAEPGSGEAGGHAVVRRWRHVFVRETFGEVMNAVEASR